MRSELAYGWSGKVQSISKIKSKTLYLHCEGRFCLREAVGELLKVQHHQAKWSMEKVLGLAAVKRFWDKGTGKSGDRRIWGNNAMVALGREGLN